MTDEKRLEEIRAAWDMDDKNFRGGLCYIFLDCRGRFDIPWLLDEIDRLKAERDAAIKDMNIFRNQASMKPSGYLACVHNKVCTQGMIGCKANGGFEWRGIQEDNNEH